MATRRRSRLEQFFIRINHRLRDRTDTYLARRPHRSFHRTRRRDYARSFALPGYIGLTRETAGTLHANRWLFGSFFLLYAVTAAVVLGIASQANYASVTDALTQSTPNVFLRTLTIFGAAISGGFNPTASTDTGVLAGLLLLLGWLTMVWLLRHVTNGTAVRLRDGLYNAGAPLIPTALVAVAGLLQALPLIATAIVYSAAVSSNFLAGGVETMLFVAVAALLALLSLYWLSSTFIALVVVTLPGMYPWAALRAAGDLAVGRRLRLLLRLLWLGLLIVIVWAVVLIPTILLAGVLPVSWLPLVPVAILGLTAFSLVLSSTYIYLLYRKMVDDGAPPA